MAQGSVAIVQQVYQTMKDGDFPGSFGLVAPTVKIWQTEDLLWGGNYEGLDEAKIFFSKVTGHLNASVAFERSSRERANLLHTSDIEGTPR